MITTFKTRRAACLCQLLMLLATLAGCDNRPHWHANDVSGKLPELAFSLTDEHGDAVTAANYRGQPALLFFGYTHCPDVCPMTLSRLRAALKKLPEQDRQDIRVLFVSIDPQRDNLEQLARYTDAFGEQFVGLSGNDQQLQQITRRFFVAFSRNSDNENYEMTHSSMVFAFAADGQARLLIRDESSEQIAEDLEQLLQLGRR